MPLINCEIILILTWSKTCFFDGWYFRKLKSNIWNNRFVPVLTLSSEHNVKLLNQLESGFKRTISWNKYQSKVTQETLNRKLAFLTDPCFQGVNRLSVISFEDRRVSESYKEYFLSTA